MEDTTVGGGGVLFDDSTLVLLKNECSSDPDQDPLDSLWLPNSSPSFHGSASMVNFEENSSTAERQLYAQIGSDGCNEDSGCEGCFGHRPEKKRRLSPDQVQFLEKSFEVENKLEPERKVQLAKELGLQPRQVAIWFQNRRARYKTKLLEKEYDSLRSSYDKLKADYDALFKENEKTRNEVNLLMVKLISRGVKTSDDDDPITSPLKKAAIDGSGTSSAKSDVVDSDSPRRHCPGAAAASSSSDYSQDDRVRLGFFVPKVEAEEEDEEEEEYHDELQPNSCNLGFPVQNQGTWLWQY